LDAFVQFLYIIGAVFIPLFAIVVVDYFLLKKRRYSIQDLYAPSGSYWFKRGISLVALVAWIIGVAIYYAVQQSLPDLGATLPSFIATSLIYYIMRRGFGDL
ncbi:MAG: cytosine permease, partial [Candidatus Methanomethyliaceae archaeon]